MKKKSLMLYLFAQLLICFLYSCNENKEITKQVDYWKGRKIELPSLNLARELENENPLKKEIKVLTIIDGGCGICIEELKQWKIFMNKIDLRKVGFIYLCSSGDDLQYFKKIYKDSIKINYPYFEDIGRKIFKKNKFSSNKLFQTFLLDSNDKVVLIGNPNESEKMNKIYLREIEKLIDSSGDNYKIQTTKLGNLTVTKKGVMTEFTFKDKVIYQDELGNVLSEKQVKDRFNSNEYDPIYYVDKNVMVLKKIGK